MIFSFTQWRRPGRTSQVGIWGSLLALLPLLSQGQTTIINYDFNTATAYPVAPAATAAGVAAVATSSQAFATVAGAATGPGAYAVNTAGNALNMTNSGGTGKYFDFALSGAALPKYAGFKLYLQGRHPTSGASTLTLQYSLNGGAFTAFGVPYSMLEPDVFTEGAFDLSGISALNAPTSLTFRLVASGASGSGGLRIDNFQVQATNTVDPLISGLAPATAEAGSPDFALAVGGSNFQRGAVVRFNGLSLTTTFNSATSLTAQVPAAAVATSGSYPVTVSNPAATGSSASPAATFVVILTPPHWTGLAGNPSWFDAANWSTKAVPGPTDEVLLDHRFVAGPYTVSLDQNVAVSIKSLTVNPGVGDSIFALVPATNTLDAALTLTNTGTGAIALAIYNKGVVTNASGVTATGANAVAVAGSGPTVFIYDGGSYRHASSRGHATVADNLSAAPGTELGIFDFRLPAAGPSSYTVSASGRTYGTVIFRNRPGATTSNYAGSGGSLTVQGNLIIASGVTFTTTLSNDLRLAGDLRSQGTLQVRAPTSPASLVSQLVLIGTKPQTVSGTIFLGATVGLGINNPAGATLATPLTLSGPLALTSGALTTSTTNLLTMSAAASLIGGSATSFVNGPLARQTPAGPLSNLTFPTGGGATYRPVVLDATAQSATTYLVTQKEGPAPDYNNLLAGTPARPTLTRVSQIRAYTITPTPATNNFSGTITLSFGPDDRVDSSADAGLAVGKNSGAGWENIGSSSFSVLTPVPASGYISGTLTSGTFTSFSDFALARTNAASSPNPLPVTLVSFVARRQAGAVQLSWATASELNSHQFAVQRSLDGRRFATFATVAGHGTTTQAQTYAALDPAAPSQALYYRLAQFDTDGTVAFSPVVTLAAASGSPTPSLYPNPAHNRLTLSAPAGTTVQVLDLTGRVLQTSSLPPSGEVMLSGLPAGLYLLRSADGQRWWFNKE